MEKQQQITSPTTPSGKGAAISAGSKESDAPPAPDVGPLASGYSPAPRSGAPLSPAGSSPSAASGSVPATAVAPTVAALESQRQPRTRTRTRARRRQDRRRLASAPSDRMLAILWSIAAASVALAIFVFATR